MDIISTVLAMSKNNETEGDYYKDGLLHCGKCHTPKQLKLPLAGKEYTVYCLCKCESERVKAQELLEAEQKKLERLDYMRGYCFPSESMWEIRFGTPDDDQRVKRYVENWDKMRELKTGMLFYGATGTGKSYAAAQVCNELIDKGYRCKYTSFSRIADERLAGNPFEVNFDLIVFDDLGVERKSDFMSEVVFDAVDGCVKASKPMIITTNLTIQEIKTPTNLRDGRIYDRVIERCVPVEFNGKNLRRRSVCENYNAVKEVLGL